MKKAILYTLCLLLAAAVGASGCWLVLQSREPASEQPVSSVSADAPVSSSQLVDLALDVAELLKNGEYEDLSCLVHPEYGLVISPSATVNLSANLCFSAKEVAGFGEDNQSYIWGLTVDSMTPINLTADRFLHDYVFDYDYTNSVSLVIGVNTVVRTGNSLENVTDIFPGAQFVDLCNPGTEEKELTDWSILRLVFEDYEGTFMLSGIIHSEYTM